jgi:glycosyltransferase involved in cell wall biosynthesis
MEANALKGRDIAVDARFLKRKGIGISRYLAQSVTELIEAGANVSLLLDDPNWCAEMSREYPAANIVPVLGDRSRLLWEQFALRKHLRGAAYDAFIAPANYGLPLGYRGPTRLILIVHDVIPLRLPRRNLLNSPVWAAFYLLSTGIAVAKADRIVTVSDSSARDIVHLLLQRRGRISVVYPHIAEPYRNGQEASESLRKEFGDYFVFNGGADPRKNVPMLLRAMALLAERASEARLVILGTGYDRFLELIEDLGIDDRVHLLGYVSESRKEEILSGAIGMVYPSIYEGFGMPLIEGMAAGIPVITGTGGSLTEVGGNAAIYVRPLNEQCLASAMVEATQEATRVRAQTAGREQLAELARRQRGNRLADVVVSILEDGQ